MHRYHYVFGDDGDYIVWESHDGFDWITHSYWMIPNSYIEGYHS